MVVASGDGVLDGTGKRGGCECGGFCAFWGCWRRAVIGDVVFLVGGCDCPEGG